MLAVVLASLTTLLRDIKQVPYQDIRTHGQHQIIRSVLLLFWCRPCLQMPRFRY